MAHLDATAVRRGVLVGVAAWIALGVTVTLVDAAGARTIGVLPSWPSLACLVGVSLVAVSLARRRPPGGLVALALLAGAVPWLPLPALPWVDAWSGATALPIFVLLGATLIVPHDIWDRPKLGPWLAAAGAAVWLGAIVVALGPRGISGDEPHYLLIAHSVWSDGDFDLKNNYDARDLLAYYAGPLEPRHVSLGVLGQEYSFHGPGVGLLVLPAYVIGGPTAARLLVAMLVACGSGFLWSTARRLMDSPRAAWVAWLAFISGAPLALNATMVYPDGPGAAICALALWGLIRAVDDRPGPSLAALASFGLALALLPWLHLRLGLISAAFGVAFIATLVRRPDGVTRVLWFSVAPVIACALLFAASWVMFAELDPTAVFRQQASGSLAAARTGLVGLLFDQEFGLLPYAPYLALAPLGLVPLWKRAPLVAVTALVISAATLVLGASWVWWGGQSAPARFLVAVLPALAIGAASAWASGGAVRRSLTGVALAGAASLTMLMATADAGAYGINHPDGRGTIFEWLSPSVDLSTALPSIFRDGATTASELSVAAVWMAGAGLTALLLWLANRLRPETPVGLSSAAAMTIAACGLAAGVVWAMRPHSPWTFDRGQMALLAAAGDHRFGPALMSPGPRPATRTALATSLSIRAPRPEPAGALLHVPMLPAGRYRISAESRPLASPPTLALALGQDAWPFATWVASGEGPTFQSAFPVWAARVTAPGSDPHTVDVDVRLHPLEIAADSSRRPLAWRVTPYGALVVYSLDRSSHPEQGGLWLGADRDSVLAAADREGRARPVRWHLEAGEAAVRVDASDDDGWTSTRVLSAGVRDTLEPPVSADGQPRPLRFTVRGGFQSRDGRRLGVWVSVGPR